MNNHRGSDGLWVGIQSAEEWVPQTPGFESWSQQRKATCLLSIWKSLACASASKLATTNMYIARARCKGQPVSSELNALCFFVQKKKKRKMKWNICICISFIHSFIQSFIHSFINSLFILYLFILSIYLYICNGPNGHLFYIGGDLIMRRGMLPIIMFLFRRRLANCVALSAALNFWIFEGSAHNEETVVEWRNQLRMKNSAT